jgi:hypothetical protein
MLTFVALQFCISPPKTDMENTVVVNDYAQMDRILREERNYILQTIKKIRATGCNVLLIQKSILRDAVTDLSLHYLVRRLQPQSQFSAQLTYSQPMHCICTAEKAICSGFGTHDSLACSWPKLTNEHVQSIAPPASRVHACAPHIKHG